MKLRSFLVPAVAALCLAVEAVPAQADGSVTCRGIDTPISVEGAPNGAIYGRYCRSGRSTGKPLQILVPGVTYTHTYFDLPGFGRRYSYTKFMNVRGYDTLAIDRLGMGSSTRPAVGARVNAFSNADALHQVIDAVRSKGLSGRHYGKIVLTGHSYGTFVSDLTSATYGDVDGVIGTGWFQQPTPLGAAGVFEILWPAAIDPRFFGRILDPSYVTTQPDARGFFYESANADPAVIAKDEATKDTASTSETTYLVPENTGLTTRIGVPTLRVIGALDRVMCNPDPCTQRGLEKDAPALFPAGVDVYVQRGAGHNVALERNNSAGFRASLAWLQKRFPARAHVDQSKGVEPYAPDVVPAVFGSTPIRPAPSPSPSSALPTRRAAPPTSDERPVSLSSVYGMVVLLAALAFGGRVAAYGLRSKREDDR